LPSPRAERTAHPDSPTPRAERTAHPGFAARTETELRPSAAPFVFGFALRGDSTLDHGTMSTASIRELRTSFAKIRARLDREGHVISTGRGKSAFFCDCLRPFVAKTDRLDASGFSSGQRNRPALAVKSLAP